MGTKQRILQEALRLFSQKGYDAVSVEQIADAVGIRAPSLYKHYRGKQDIFEAIIEETGRRYDAFTEGISVRPADPEQELRTFEGITADVLVGKVQALVSYSIHDEFVGRFRRMMTIEQFRSPELSALYSQRYVEQIQSYHTGLFRRLTEAGVLCGEDPAVLAMLYDSPIIVLLGECDRHPEKEREVMEKLEAHVRLFYKTFSRKPREKAPEKRTKL